MKAFISLCLLFVITASFAQETTSPDSIAQQMKYAAKNGLIDKYYPANIDTLYGGYLSTFTYDFRPEGAQDKMIVTQARHTWSTAKAALFYHDTSYIGMSGHGYHFLRDKLWDGEYGGFYNLVTRQGEPKTMIKQAYGNAFGIFALAAYYECSHDTAALDLAKKAFLWLEKHSHDPIRKGYYQYLQRDGTPLQRTAAMPGTSDIGYKDQNSSIHLLEALTALYRVWPDALVKARLEEMLLLIRDKIVEPEGSLHLYFTAGWKPVSYRDSSRAVIRKNHYIDHVSFGHDLETVYLMLEATEALGNKNDIKTIAVGKRMADHALHTGWDNALGGFYDEGYYFKDSPGMTITVDSKNWWAQAEGLNTLLLLSDRYPNDTMQYYQHFTRLWDYVQRYLIDHEHGDWYEEGLDREPQQKTALKAHIWKGSYHNFRSLSNCITRIETDRAASPAGASLTIFGRGMYPGNDTMFKQLSVSGFTTVILSSFYIHADGDLYCGDDNTNPIIHNGQYTGSKEWLRRLASLKQQPGSVTRIELLLEGRWINQPPNTFDFIRDWSDATKTIPGITTGTGTNSTLYKIAKALKEEMGIDAVCIDDEAVYNSPSIVRLGAMVDGLNMHMTLCPYTNYDYWKDIISRSGKYLIDAVYLQCYDGGAGNAPGPWKNKLATAIPVYPIFMCRGSFGTCSSTKGSLTPAAIKAEMIRFKKEYTGLAGGAIWQMADVISYINKHCAVQYPESGSATAVSQFLTQLAHSLKEGL